MPLSTPGIESRFPLLERPSKADARVAEAQVSRPLAGEYYVAARCPFLRPAVLLTVPAPAESVRIPPLIWLTCPHAVNGAGSLESRGLVEEYRKRIESSPESRAAHLGEDEGLSVDYYELARDASGEEFARMVEGKGVAGGGIGAVKCLHAHLAYRLSSGRGIVGGWVMVELERGNGVWCQRAPEACLD